MTCFASSVWSLSARSCTLSVRIMALLTWDENMSLTCYLIKSRDKGDRFVFTGFRECCKIDSLVNG